MTLWGLSDDALALLPRFPSFRDSAGRPDERADRVDRKRACPYAVRFPVADGRPGPGEAGVVRPGVFVAALRPGGEPADGGDSEGERSESVAVDGGGAADRGV